MTQKSYALLQDELRTILDQLEAGDHDIDAALKLYERGLKLVKQLQARLEAAEHTVTTLRAGD